MSCSANCSSICPAISTRTSAEERIDMMAPPRPTELHQHRIRLTREPAAVAEARNRVRATLSAWRVQIDPDIAVLLTSDLVTSAIMHGNGQAITLCIRCSSGQLRVDCYDTSSAAAEPTATATSRGLALIAMLATEWGSFGTPAGRVVYFTLAFDREVPGVVPASRTFDESHISKGDTWKAFRSAARTNGSVQAAAGLRAR
jgi:hypothetical protein